MEDEMLLNIIKDRKTFHPTKEFEGILRHAFEVYARELGWKEGGPTVEVRFRPLDRSTGGMTDAMALRPFKVDMQITEPSVAIYNLAHELVHVDQLERGDLRTDEFEQKSYWKGVAIERKDQFAVETPPEVEAYGRGPEMYEVLLQELSHEEMLFLLRNNIQTERTGTVVYENFKEQSERVMRERKEMHDLWEDIKKLAEDIRRK